MNPRVEKFFATYEKMLPTRDDQIELGVHNLCMAGALAEFILDKARAIKRNEDIDYILAIVLNNQFTFHTVLNNDTIIPLEPQLDLADMPITNKEKMIHILKNLIETYKIDLK